MPDKSQLIAFALIAFGMALTPGPNMVYLVSRSISQGRAAGIVSLGGVALGFVIYMICAATGISVLLLAVPYAYDGVRLAGALYLFWLGCRALHPGGKSPFRVHDLPADSTARLFVTGLLTSLLNPKIALIYLSLLPQFLNAAKSFFAQTIVLGTAQIMISVVVNLTLVLTAASIARLLMRSPRFELAQRWIMGATFLGLAYSLASESRR